jgi:hypothetical protein
MGDNVPETDVETARMHACRALSRAVGPDTLTHCHAALRALDPDLGDPLVECPVCERIGLPERIAEHECGRGRCYAGP